MIQFISDYNEEHFPDVQFTIIETTPTNQGLDITFTYDKDIHLIAPENYQYYLTTESDSTEYTFYFMGSIINGEEFENYTMLESNHLYRLTLEFDEQQIYDKQAFDSLYHTLWSDYTSRFYLQNSEGSRSDVLLKFSVNHWE